MSLFLFLECTTALRWQIAAVSDRVSQKLRCSRLPDKKVPVHSNIGTSEWRSWKLSFVALATNEGCATLAWCDRISEYQWWTVLPRSGHSADVAGVLRWHRTVDCCSSQADLLQTPVPSRTNVLAASVVNELRIVRSCLSWKKHEQHIAATWSCMVSRLSRWTPRLDTVVENRMLADSSWNSLMLTLASCCLDPIHITCVLSAFIFSLLLLIQDSIFSVQLTNLWTAVSTSAAPVLTCTCVSSA